MKTGIHSKMAEEMKIIPFPEENEDRFIARVIYSALSEWIKASTFDRKIDDQEGVTEDGCTKHHITRKCGDILKGFLEIYPQIEDYFYPEDEKDPKPIQEIQKRLFSAGVLVSGINNTVQLSQKKYGFVTDNLYFERGNFPETGNQISGLGSYINRVPENSSTQQLEELFFIPDENAESTFYNFNKRMKGKYTPLSEIPENWRFFDFNSKKSFYKSWIPYFDETNKITAYKNSNNILDYGIIKNNNGTLSSITFPNHIVDTKEVRRFLYGIRSAEGNPCKAKLTLMGKSVNIEFYTSLPQREQTLLNMIAWPVRSMYDRTQYTAPIVFLPIIKKMFKNLNVDIG
ncbi:hypothetical protein [Methanoplanus limicola]|uniref:Uncharacterized protein n=1 Tax=Methanoplanus limicola DSM 2279 TaxID=937775 RepID=H1Z389_9EURY|nr:hypothetical protein [Methanoplanus limicola]EHQ36504.1 hypothetical protein Metlim_2456 [Methanoplanus limicola DSM 2279]